MQAWTAQGDAVGVASGRSLGGSRLEVAEGVLEPRLLTAWDELAVATKAPPWARPGWLVPWWRWMGHDRPLVLALRSGSELSAVLPLQRTRGGLSSPTNWHTPEYAVVACDEAHADEVLRRATGRCGSRLTLDFVPPALAEQLVGVAERAGERSHARVLESSPYIALQGDWLGSVDKHLLSELRRRARRLAERGTVAVEARDGSERLDPLLEEGLRVEASGWKGRAGTAILSSPETHSFYREVARWAADEGLLRLSFLRLDGAAVAFDFSIEHDGTHFLLKTGYDEGLRALAPGKQLRLRTLEECTARGLHSYELLGDAQEWKGAWTSLRHDRWQVHAFPRGPAGTRGWMVHAKAMPLARTARDGLSGVRGRLVRSTSGGSGAAG